MCLLTMTAWSHWEVWICTEVVLHMHVFFFFFNKDGYTSNLTFQTRIHCALSEYFRWISWFSKNACRAIWYALNISGDYVWAHQTLAAVLCFILIQNANWVQRLADREQKLTMLTQTRHQIFSWLCSLCWRRSIHIWGWLSKDMKSNNVTCVPASILLPCFLNSCHFQSSCRWRQLRFQTF